MAKIQPIHKNIFLFVLGNGADGYAEVVEGFKRKEPGDRTQAWDEIKNGEVAKMWDVVPASQRAAGIDMAFAATEPCLVFVAISGDHSHETEVHAEDTVGLFHNATTYFGTDIVKELAIRGKLTASIIKDAKRHKLPGSGYHTVCSFEVDCVTVMRVILATSGAGNMTRFPIVFDFVDSDDGRSPVFKKPRPNYRPASAAGILARLGHGGIHPRGGSSLIILE
jgi:hypothetical protein